MKVWERFGLTEGQYLRLPAYVRDAIWAGARNIAQLERQIDTMEATKAEGSMDVYGRPGVAVSPAAGDWYHYPPGESLNDIRYPRVQIRSYADIGFDLRLEGNVLYVHATGPVHIRPSACNSFTVEAH